MFNAEIKEAQELIDSGNAWKFEGSVGRHCMDMITAGYCMLGKVSHRDTYGNYVPSRYEVKAGTKGSSSYVRRMIRERNNSQFGEVTEFVTKEVIR